MPIMWSHGTGSEVMKRIAAPMGGRDGERHRPYPHRGPCHLRFVERPESAGQKQSNPAEL